MERYLNENFKAENPKRRLRQHNTYPKSGMVSILGARLLKDQVSAVRQKEKLREKLRTAILASKAAILFMQAAAPHSNDVIVDVPTQDIIPVSVGPPVNAPEWFSLFMNFCFAGASISLQANQALRSGQPSISFQMASLGMVSTLASFVVSKYLPRNVGGAWARALENVGVFCGVTGFLIYITPSFFLVLKIIAWIIYVVSLLAIIISRNFIIFRV